MELHVAGGRFYPADLPATRWLNYYATRFDTVEINDPEAVATANALTLRDMLSKLV
jgi:hypothetical protein